MNAEITKSRVKPLIERRSGKQASGTVKNFVGRSVPVFGFYCGICGVAFLCSIADDPARIHPTCA